MNRALSSPLSRGEARKSATGDDAVVSSMLPEARAVNDLLSQIPGIGGKTSCPDHAINGLDSDGLMVGTALLQRHNRCRIPALTAEGHRTRRGATPDRPMLGADTDLGDSRVTGLRHSIEVRWYSPQLRISSLTHEQGSRPGCTS